MGLALREFALHMTSHSDRFSSPDCFCILLNGFFRLAIFGTPVLRRPPTAPLRQSSTRVARERRQLRDSDAPRADNDLGLVESAATCGGGRDAHWQHVMASPRGELWSGAITPSVPSQLCH
jgi:hypothetical protein